MRYKLIIAYDGTSYCGWQVQKSGISIQSIIQQALEKVLRHPVDLTGSGRTDAGVHAKGQTAHFDTPTAIEPMRLQFALNGLIPKEIRIFDILAVPSDFHARYSAISKIYHYHLHLDPVSDPFTHPYRYVVRGNCNITKMQEAITYLLGTHDFTSLANRARGMPAKKNGIRTLYRLDLIEQKGGVRLEFEASGFLYKMVRNITGLLLSVGQGRIEPEDIPKIIQAKNRQSSFKAVPPQGLFLFAVNYTSNRSVKLTQIYL